MLILVSIQKDMFVTLFYFNKHSLNHLSLIKNNCDTLILT